MKLSIETANSVENDRNYIDFCAKAILVFFKLLGLATPTFGRTVRSANISKNGSKPSRSIQFSYSISGCFYNVFLIVFLIATNCVSIPLVSDMEYPYKSTLTVTFELIGAISATATVILMWVLYCVKQMTIVNLLNRLLTIDRTIFGLHRGRPTQSNRYYFVCLFVGNWLVWIAVFISTRKCFDTPILNVFNNFVPLTIVNWSIIQYVVMIKLIEIRFRSLNHALFDNARSSILLPIRSAFILESVTMENHHNLPKIIEFRRAHFLLYEIACDFANVYSLPITLSITLGCYVIVYNSYYTAMMFLMKIDDNKYLIIFNALLWISTMLVPIMLLSAGVDRIADEMKSTADVVHKLLTRTIIKREDKSELEDFSLELVQRNVTFDASGLFTLDCTLVHSIFSMVAMYLVILLQFELAT